MTRDERFDEDEWARLTPLGRAVENAANLRDMQYDDAAAAKVLDVALKRNADAGAVDRARALAAFGHGDRGIPLQAELAALRGQAVAAQLAPALRLLDAALAAF